MILEYFSNRHLSETRVTHEENKQKIKDFKKIITAYYFITPKKYRCMHPFNQTHINMVFIVFINKENYE
jgi:hypothetical protein